MAETERDTNLVHVVLVLKLSGNTSVLHIIIIYNLFNLCMTSGFSYLALSAGPFPV